MAAKRMTDDGMEGIGKGARGHEVADVQRVKTIIVLSTPISRTNVPIRELELSA